MKRTLLLITLFCAGLLALAGCTGQAGAEAVDQTFTLRTGMVDGRMAYIGVGGAIDGLANPDLTVQAGQRVRIELVNGDGPAHDLALPDLARQTALITGKGTRASVTFTATAGRAYAYFCTAPGHRQAGMEGRLVVTP
jgi:nitrite reductase (NO-forming)